MIAMMIYVHSLSASPCMFVFPPVTSPSFSPCFSSTLFFPLQNYLPLLSIYSLSLHFLFFYIIFVDILLISHGKSTFQVAHDTILDLLSSPILPSNPYLSLTISFRAAGRLLVLGSFSSSQLVDRLTNGPNAPVKISPV